MDCDKEKTTSSDTESTGSDSHVASIDVNLDSPSNEVAKMLECPVCYDIVLPPIILCTSGHSVCNPCRSNLRQCPTCRGHFSRIRNRFAEEFLDKCKISCKYRDGGCSVTLPGRRLAEHQIKCNNR